MPMSSHVLVVTTPPAPQRQLVYSVKFPEELFQQVVEQQGGRVRFAKGNDAVRLWCCFFGCPFFFFGARVHDVGR